MKKWKKIKKVKKGRRRKKQSRRVNDIEAVDGCLVTGDSVSVTSSASSAGTCYVAKIRRK